MVRWTNARLSPKAQNAKRHLDLFSRFCRFHGRRQHARRHADHGTCDACSSRPHDACDVDDRVICVRDDDGVSEIRGRVPRDVPVSATSEQHQAGSVSAGDRGDRAGVALCHRLSHGRRLRPRRSQVLLKQLRLDLPATPTLLRRYRQQSFTHSLVSPPALRQAHAKRAYVLLVFYFLKIFLVISVRPIISTSARPIFAKFAGLVELWT